MPEKNIKDDSAQYSEHPWDVQDRSKFEDSPVSIDARDIRTIDDRQIRVLSRELAIERCSTEASRVGKIVDWTVESTIAKYDVIIKFGRPALAATLAAPEPVVSKAAAVLIFAAPYVLGKLPGIAAEAYSNARCLERVGATYRIGN